MARAGARTAVQAGGQAAAVTTGKVLARGAANGLLAYGAVEVITQEIASPGKTVDDLRRGRIQLKSNEVGAHVAGGAAAALAGAAGVAALPAAAAGIAVTGTVLIADQEIKDPGKTARDIKQMTNGAVDLKKAGSDVNKFVAKAGKDIEKSILSIFGGK